MKRIAIVALASCALLLVRCATANQDCPVGQELNEAGTECVSIQCEGGTLEGNTCACPSDLVLNEGRCVDPACADVSCNDGNPCTIDGTCNPSTRECEGGGNAPSTTLCDEDGGTVCDGRGNCVECNGPDQCDDGNDCTDDTCDTAEGSCSSTNVSNGNQCDFEGSEGVCNAGTCEAAPCDLAFCQDANDCTAASCPPGASDCSVVNVEAGVGCEADGVSGLCDGAGACVECLVTTDCADDGNPCTEPVCQDGACGSLPKSGDCTTGDNLAGQCRGGECDPGPPSVTSIFPATGASNLSTCLNMVATFDRPLDPATVNATTILVNQGFTPIPLDIQYNPNNDSVIFAPVECLETLTLTAISIRGVKDLAGREMTTAFTSNFATNAVDCGTNTTCGIQ